MDEKTLALDLLEKGANLYRFLSGEKSEHAISDKFFNVICQFTEYCYSLKNPALGKNEIVALRKSMSVEADKINLYLDLLFSSGYISAAQKDSILKTLDTLKKQINI